MLGFHPRFSYEMYCALYKTELEGTYQFIVQYHPYRDLWKSLFYFSVRKKYSSALKWA